MLPRFHAELKAVLANLLDSPGEPFKSVEIIYIDDGSGDGTLTVLRDLAGEDPRVRYLSLSRNFGHQAALTAGLEHARGDVVITLDSDLQHPPSLIPTLLDRWHQGYDIVLTVRAEDSRLSWFKRKTSQLFYWGLRWLSSTEVPPACADYRLLSRRAVDALLRLREHHRFLRGMVGWLGFPTTQVPFQPGQRAAGVSKYTLRRMVSLALDGTLSFSYVPMRLALGAGALCLCTGLAVLLLLLARWLFGALAYWQFQGLLAAVLLVGGAVLVGLGIVGEYVGRIFEQVKQRPLYLVKDSSFERRTRVETKRRGRRNALPTLARCPSESEFRDPLFDEDLDEYLAEAS